VLLHHGLGIATARGAAVLLRELVVLMRRSEVGLLMRLRVRSTHWGHYSMSADTQCMSEFTYLILVEFPQTSAGLDRHAACTSSVAVGDLAVNLGGSSKAQHLAAGYRNRSRRVLPASGLGIGGNHDRVRKSTLASAGLSACPCRGHWRAGWSSSGHPYQEAVGSRIVAQVERGDQRVVRQDSFHSVAPELAAGSWAWVVAGRDTCSHAQGAVTDGRMSSSSSAACAVLRKGMGLGHDVAAHGGVVVCAEVFALGVRPVMNPESEAESGADGDEIHCS
jgi:hypothetical protein